MLGKVLKNEQGIALVVTVAVCMLLVAVSLELNKKVRTTVFSSAAARDRVTLSYMASSGVHVGMMLLVADKNKDKEENRDEKKWSDTIMEEWADTDIIADALANIPFEDGEVTLEISDELGKIQINALVDYPKGREFNVNQKQLWDRFLRPIVSLDEESDLNATADIINSVKDWLDFGDDDAITGLNGAESEYYEGLDPPYSCRNGPFTHLSELMLVKDIKPEYFQAIGGASLDALSGGAAQGLAGEMIKQFTKVMTDDDAAEESDPEDFGDMSMDDLGVSSEISDFMTVFGRTQVDPTKKVEDRSFTYEGKVNINTAGMPVLAAILPTGQEYLAASIYTYRQWDGTDTTGLVSTLNFIQQSGNLPQNIGSIPAGPPDFTKDDWYKNAPGWPSGQKIDANLITKTSNFFRIESTAFLNEMQMTIIAVVQREEIKNDNYKKKWQCKVLSWETK